MATTTSITTTYAGESKNQIISAALLAGNTLANGLITFKPNIIGKEVVRRLETDGLIKGATCDFSDTSTITSTERIIEPKEFQVNLELCKTDWLNDWIEPPQWDRSKGCPRPSEQRWRRSPP